MHRYHPPFRGDFSVGTPFRGKAIDSPSPGLRIFTTNTLSHAPSVAGGRSFVSVYRLNQSKGKDGPCHADGPSLRGVVTRRDGSGVRRAGGRGSRTGPSSRPHRAAAGRQPKRRRSAEPASRRRTRPSRALAQDGLDLQQDPQHRWILRGGELALARVAAGLRIERVEPSTAVRGGQQRLYQGRQRSGEQTEDAYPEEHENHGDSPPGPDTRAKRCPAGSVYVGVTPATLSM